MEYSKTKIKRKGRFSLFHKAAAVLLLFSLLTLSSCTLFGGGEAAGAPTKQTALEEERTETARDSETGLAENEKTEKSEAAKKEGQKGEAIGDPREEESAKAPWQRLILSDDEKILYQELAIEDFKTWLTEQDEPVFVDFWAVWCGPCLRAAPSVKELAQKNGDRLIVLKGNVDYLPRQLAEDLGIVGIPAFFLYSKAEKVNNWTGFSPSIFKKIQENIELLAAQP